MGLVYSTLLSLVPLLAVVFSVLKAFGAQYQIRPLLEHVRAPVGAQGSRLLFSLALDRVTSAHSLAPSPAALSAPPMMGASFLIASVIVLGRYAARRRRK